MKSTLISILSLLIQPASAFILPKKGMLSKLDQPREHIENPLVPHVAGLFSSVQQEGTDVIPMAVNGSAAVVFEGQNVIISDADIVSTETNIERKLLGFPNPDASSTISRGINRRSSMKRFMSAIFTVQDAPIRFHAISSAVFTFGGGVWLLMCLASLMGISSTATSANAVELDIIFAASWGLIISGLFYMPKSKRYEHYRRTFIATSAIMAADTMLWFWFSNSSSISSMSQGSIAPFVVPMACFSYILALMGEIQFVLNDENNRQEALDTDLISEAIAAPIWKYIAIAPTHFTTATLKTVGMYHLLVGGTQWIDENPQAAAFGAALYMSNMILAAWSAFTQGTMTIRRTPAFGKDVYRLENDFVTWGIFAAVFIPLIITALVGCTSGSLQSFFSV